MRDVEVGEVTTGFILPNVSYEFKFVFVYDWDDAAEEANRLGREGWRLAGIHPETEDETPILILTRHLQALSEET